jgi:hypothetical protein
MTLDDVMEAWRSKDLSQLYGVDKTLLHLMLREEQAKLETQRRRMTRFVYVVNAFLVITAALFFVILIDPNQPPAFSARLVVWDYVVGIAGVAAAVTMAGALFALHRSRQAREQDFGDSLRDHLRRRIAQLDAEVTGERRVAWTTFAAMLVCTTAISILSGRISHEPVRWTEMIRPSFGTVLFLAFLCLALFRWSRTRQDKVQRKRQLEALLKEFDSSTG